MIRPPPSVTRPDALFPDTQPVRSMMVTGSTCLNSYMKSEVDQAQVRGSFDFADYSRLYFGVATTKVQNRTAYNFTQRDDWGGFGNGAADYADNLWIADDISRYFDQFPGSGDAFGQFFLFDFESLREAAIAARGGDEAAYQIGRAHV